MTALPYMPLYVADYLADTAHLTALENGAYLMLLMNYWQRGKAIPSGDKQLARIARLTDEQWAEVKPALEEFFTEQDGLWVHGRVEQELSKVRAKSEQASNAGKASAKRKSNGRSTDVQRTINHTDTDTDTDIKISPPLPPKGFDEFMAIYPKRDSSPPKKPSIKAFNGALKRSDLETILQGAREFAAAMKAKGKIGTEFVPLPATWLNQDRFNERYDGNTAADTEEKARARAILEKHFAPVGPRGDG